MSLVNFRYLGDDERRKMRVHNAAAYEALEDAEQAMSGGVWIRPSDFPGCFSTARAERPAGRGQIFKF